MFVIILLIASFICSIFKWYPKTSSVSKVLEEAWPIYYCQISSNNSSFWLILLQFEDIGGCDTQRPPISRSLVCQFLLLAMRSSAFSVRFWNKRQQEATPDMFFKEDKNILRRRNRRKNATSYLSVPDSIAYHPRKLCVCLLFPTKYKM